jgi:hypothetical protein
MLSSLSSYQRRQIKQGGQYEHQHELVERSHNVYISSAILTACLHFPRGERFIGELMLPAAVKVTQVYMQSSRYFSSVLPKFRISKISIDPILWNPH